MRVLSLDGGGVKGVLEARLLERLESEAPFLHKVELFAGTSTGGILALALAAGVPVADCVALYELNATRIFASRGLSDSLAGGLDEYVRADYSQDGLRDVLTETFGNKRLPELEREVLVPAFDLARFRPKFLDRSDDWSLVDAALATSAAPTYLPVHIVRESLKGRATSKGSVRALIDGGVFCNNPSKAASDFARHRLGAKIITLLSLGAGQTPYAPPEELLTEASKMLDWGFRQWLVKHPHLLLKVLFDGSVVANHYSSRVELGDSYYRLQPVLPEDVDLADAAKVPLLKAVADAYDLEEALAWVKMRMGGQA